MASDTQLRGLLQALRSQNPTHTEAQYLGTASRLLSTLGNTHNLSLLTSHLLSSPAIWNNHNGVTSCLQFMLSFQRAAVEILKLEEDKAAAKASTTERVAQPTRPIKRPSRQEWIKAVLAGASPDTPRWRHMLVFAGLLVGFESRDQRGLPRSVRRTVETAMVTATNVAVDEAWDAHRVDFDAITLSLNHAFPYISDIERSHLDHNRLLPILTRSAFFSHEGLASARFMENIDRDIQKLPGGKISWPKDSPSFLDFSKVASRPLVLSLGPMANVVAYVCESLTEQWLLQSLLDDLAKYSEQVISQWSSMQLSTIVHTDEVLKCDTETVTITLHTLMKTLNRSLFATGIILKAVLSRMLQESNLADDDLAPDLVTQTLRILRNLYFITIRLGPQRFGQYEFVYLTSLDILSGYPKHTESFLQSIRPRTIGTIPPTQTDRVFDLFFLNTSEYLALSVSDNIHDSLLIASATPYLVANTDHRLIENFEAAHSVVLAVLSSTKNPDVAYKYVPFYVDALFRVFPQSISARQFRLAFKTLLRICAPPTQLSAMHPTLTETLLELIHERASTGPAEERPAPYTAPPHPRSAGVVGTLPSPSSSAEAAAEEERLDEQAAVLMTLIDCLPYLPSKLLLEWLPLAAELIWKMPTQESRHKCQDRFWEMLTGGEMDVERSRICASWWGTQGGREIVLGREDEIDLQQQQQGYLMSGAIPETPIKAKL